MNPLVQEAANAPAKAPFPAAIEVNRERGQRAVFCGLTSIVWLHRKIQDAFFLIVGSRTCSHLMQSAAGVMIFAEPRFATAVLQERDLAGLADCNEELDRVVSQIIERRPEIRTVFLVSSCPSEVIKLDLGNAAERLGERYKGSVGFVDFSGSGIETTFTQGEDRCLTSLVSHMPVAEPSSQELVIVGSLSDIVEDQFRRIFDKIGISVSFFPGRHSQSLPAIGPGTRILLAQPFVGDTARALIGRGAQLIKAPYPLGVEGTSAWFQAAASAYGIDASLVDQATAAAVSRARKALSAVSEKLSGTRIAFLPDSQLEIPLARFLQRECNASILEVGTPFYDALTLEGELPLLSPDLKITEGQNLDPQLDRIREMRPDVTVCGMGIANPLEADGLGTKWSIELVFTPIQGFDQAADLANLFTRSLDRAQRLSI